jgi:hypothetical protein
VIAIHIDKVKFIQGKHSTKIEEQRKSALIKLKALRKSRITLSLLEQNYLDSIIEIYERNKILTSTPREIDAIKTQIGPLPACSRKPRKLKPFKKILIEVLNYSNLRNTFYPMYFNQLGLKACVYCNSTLTISIEKNASIYSARFDVDHYEPKNEFPYLSIFLFNLYPTCAPCNRMKSQSTGVDFKLYSDDLNDTKKSSYKFKLDPGSKAKFLITKDHIDLSFSFEPTLNTLQSTFKIKEIYENQKI